MSRSSWLSSLKSSRARKNNRRSPHRRLSGWQSSRRAPLSVESLEVRALLSTVPFVELEKLIASDAGVQDFFGRSVAVSNDGQTLLVGSNYDDDDGNGSGSAYVYQWNAATSSFVETKLNASDAAAYDFFGSSVAVSGDGQTLLVGSPGISANGASSDGSRGSAYVYQWNAATMSFDEIDKLTASDGVAINAFGESVGLSGDGQTLLVGRINDSDVVTQGGAAYVFGAENTNDAPSITSNALDLTEGETVVLDNTNINATDADLPGDTLTYTASAISGGQFELLADPGVAITSFTQAQIDAGEVQFVHDGGEAAPDYDLVVNDGSVDSAVSSATITFTNVNDAPTVADPIADVEANEDDPDDVIDVSNVFDDVDAGDTLTLTATSADDSLVTATMVGTDLVLDYQLNQSGMTTVTVRATDSGLLFVEDTITVDVLSASDQIQNLLAKVQGLQDAGDINGGNANALNVKLNGALNKLANGQTNAAMNQLNAFTNQINAFVNSGKLTAAQGAEITGCAQDVINSISTGGGSTLLSDGTSGESDAAKPLDHADELLSGTIGVSLAHASGSISADQQARLDDALSELNTTFGPYGVTLATLDGQTNVDVEIHIEIAASSECGSAADGILGCTAVAGEITIVDGWNWYSGADSSAIGTDQYDFRTVLTHELGHTLGSTHSGDAASVMYGWLGAADTRHSFTAQDLELVGAHDEDAPAALRAAPAPGQNTSRDNNAAVPLARVMVTPTILDMDFRRGARTVGIQKVQANPNDLDSIRDFGARQARLDLEVENLSFGGRGQNTAIHQIARDWVAGGEQKSKASCGENVDSKLVDRCLEELLSDETLN